MKRAKIIDIIKGSLGAAIRFDSKVGYDQDYAIDDLSGRQFVTKDLLLGNIPVIVSPFIYNIPANTETPILINFADSTIKFGSDPAFEVDDLTDYVANPDIKFKLIIDSTNSRPVGNDGWITNEEWEDNTYASLVEITLQPDTDSGAPGGVTLDYIIIIIKP